VAEKQTSIGKQLPADGLEITLPEGKTFTRIHLDIAQDGITLAHVGAAHAPRVPGDRRKVILKPSKEGIALAMVGAASAVKK
jgi:hypothetical protein